MPPVITAFATPPDQGQGFVRDMRVRWAFEEVGQPYQVRLITFEALKQADHVRIHPFGQIPTYEDGQLVLFETGAIVLDIAEQHPGLLPVDQNARARAIAWMFAALSTIEPPVGELGTARIMEADQPWYAARLPLLEQRVHARLRPLADWLGDKDWLEVDFSAGDLMMVTVLRRLRVSGLLGEYPVLAAYVERAEARPAFQRAFADQLAVFTAQSPIT